MTKSKDNELDEILEELGEFGKFQIINYIFISIPIFLFAGFTLSYVFAAGQLNYRCKIPECDNINQEISYKPDWLPYAVPYTNGRPSKCLQYKYVNESNIDQSGDSDANESCSIHTFNRSQIIQCPTDDLIYETDEITIANEFNITCEENEWQLAMIGSINNVAQFIFLPFAGFISDRFGRRTLFLCGLLCSTVFGLLRSFATSYTMYIILEFFDAGFGAGTYSSAFILGLELVGPRKRVFGSILISCSYSIGEALLAILAMYTQNFRILLRICYGPVILLVTYFWIIPESVRWLVITGKHERASNVLRKAARINNVKISESTIKKLYDSHLSIAVDEEKYKLTTSAKTDHSIKQLSASSIVEKVVNKSTKYPIVDVFKSKILIIRMLICSYCWLTNTLVYYGLGMNAVTLAGNKYINFVFVSLAEIPGYFVTYYVMERWGRRWPLCGSLLICGLACIASQFVPDDAAALRLTVFLIGKCAITVSFTVLYIYTAELYPTNLRHSLLSACSMVGRIGSMIAPQTPLLARYFQSLPLLIFGGTAITSGLLILNFPETINIKLPDTIEEAEHINKQRIKRTSLTLNNI